MNVAVTSTRKDNAEILIERARSLVPVLRERAPLATAERKLPKETIDDFRRLELTRCLQPAMFGGYASNYRAFSKMLRALAQGCGSSAWVAAVHGEHSWVVGQFAEQAQREVWGSNPLAVASASIAPNGEAEPAAGGHRLRGRWSFASGCDYAQWLLLGGVLKQDGKTEERMFLVPVGAVEIIDDWHVMGLCGTGSKSVVIKDLIVPPTHSVSMHDLKNGTGPGATVHADNTLYRSPRTLFASFSLSSVLVGLAERAVDTFAEYSNARALRGPRASDLETIQLVIAETAAQAATAAMLVESTIERNIALVESRQPVTVAHLAETRRNSSYAGRLAQQVVTSIVQVAGGSALFDSNPLQEIFRDVIAGTSHLSVTWHRAGQPYGRMRLGLPLEFDKV